MGSHPSASRPARRNAAGVAPPNQTGMGRWIGRGAIPTPVTWSNRPAMVTDRVVHSERSSATCSSTRRPRVEKS